MSYRKGKSVHEVTNSVMLTTRVHDISRHLGNLMSPFAKSVHDTKHHKQCRTNCILESPFLRLSTRSVLLPTSMMITSLPRSVRTSSTQRDVLKNDCRSAIHKFVRMGYIRHSLTMDPPELHNRLRNVARERLLQMENDTLALCYT
jgi:hypothetical protein